MPTKSVHSKQVDLLSIVNYFCEEVLWGDSDFVSQSSQKRNHHRAREALEERRSRESCNENPNPYPFNGGISNIGNGILTSAAQVGRY